MCICWLFPGVIYVISGLWKNCSSQKRSSSESAFLGRPIFFNWILKLNVLAMDLTISSFLLGDRGGCSFSKVSKASWLCTSTPNPCTARWLQRWWRMQRFRYWKLWRLRCRHEWWLWYRRFHFLSFSFTICSFGNSLFF